RILIKSLHTPHTGRDTTRSDLAEAA
ncbi:hypothetical protein J2Z78_000621, partial [Streptomyces griseorubens]